MICINTSFEILSQSVSQSVHISLGVPGLLSLDLGLEAPRGPSGAVLVFEPMFLVLVSQVVVLVLVLVLALQLVIFDLGDAKWF